MPPQDIRPENALLWAIMLNSTLNRCGVPQPESQGSRMINEPANENRYPNKVDE